VDAFHRVEEPSDVAEFAKQERFLIATSGNFLANYIYYRRGLVLSSADTMLSLVSPSPTFEGPCGILPSSQEVAQIGEMHLRCKMVGKEHRTASSSSLSGTFTPLLNGEGGM
jgi:hypothetical protein